LNIAPKSGSGLAAGALVAALTIDIEANPIRQSSFVIINFVSGNGSHVDKKDFTQSSQECLFNLRRMFGMVQFCQAHAHFGVRQKTMSSLESITLRKVESSDLETFYEHQLDPEAIRMAAFVCKDPKDKVAFHAHWDKILNSPQITQRTIVAQGQVVGYVGCFPLEDKMEVTYWLGREFWGRGIATQALKRMLELVAKRPIFARAATDNIGSIRVLQKCGFKIIGEDKGFANGRGEATEEYILRLDPDPAKNE
jgi:RimJ/RimL family protein N-acetyltransferase